MSDRDPNRLGPLEKVGIWLGFWRPRDVEVPPLPKRKLAVAGAVLAVALVVGAVVAVPAIREGKDEGAERDRRAEALDRAAERRRLALDQAAHRGTGRPARDQGSRAELVRRLEASIAADARARVRAGTLKGTIRRVECRPARRSAGRGSYDCTAVTADIEETGHNVAAAVGYPFVAVVDFERGRYTWCKTNPPPGERVIPDPRDAVELPPECLA